MKRKVFLILNLLCSLTFLIWAQPYVTKDKETLVLDNGMVRRLIRIGDSQNGIGTISYKLYGSDEEFVDEGSEEFFFKINEKSYSGLDPWKVFSVENIIGERDGKGVNITMGINDSDIKIILTYMLYPDLPVIRKKITFINERTEDIKVEALDLERILLSGSGVGAHCWVLHDYARQKSLGQFIGNWYDPVVVVHQINKNRGVVLGNEAPGVMKRTTAFQSFHLLTIGLTHPEQEFGFRKWIKPGESWESPWVFTAIYQGTDDPFNPLNTTINDYTRKHMGIRLNDIPQKPMFVYNTWEPFRQDINDKLIYELVDAAADCGIEEFVIDDGWQSSLGDWDVDLKKFPDGLKPVFDYIKSKGMKPGLWISTSTASSQSQVVADHPEWLVRTSDGEPVFLHSNFDRNFTMCMTSGWYDYIKGIILKLAKEHGLEYIKTDFAVVTGAYTTDKSRSGCHSHHHPIHKDRNESLLLMYQRTWDLFDELHKEAPNLFIDCTYETMGALQLIDLDMCKHAEGNWLSNFLESAPLGAMRVRQMSWWRTPTIPATALVIGNQRLDDPQFELSLISLAGSLPIVLGDPRKLTEEQRFRIKEWADFFRAIQERHDFMSYRQDLEGFGEPAEGCWDGFQRINSDSGSGGIIGIFKQNSKEMKRNVTVGFLNPESVYQVNLAPDGKNVIAATGKQLAEKGFDVVLSKSCDGAIFEISEIR